MTIGSGHGLASAYVVMSSEIELASPRMLEDIRVLVSGGNEVNDLREISGNVLDRFNHQLQHEWRARYALTQWNYLLDSSRDEEVGHLADRSIRAVDESEGVIAIVGQSVPPITRLEVRRVYELRQLGQERELWFLAFKSRTALTGAKGRMPLAEFLDEIASDFGKQRIYHEVSTELDFQASLLMEMFPWLITRTGQAFGPLGVGARS